MMQYVLHVLLGYSMAFLDLMLPGILNMTVAKTTIEKDRREGFLFALGASIVVIFQAFIALAFTKFFANNPHIIERLKIVGVFVLFILAIAFFFQARKKFKGEGSKRKGKSFVLGLLMSSMNMLVIPFYLVLSSLLESRGLLILAQPYISLFVLGVFLGSLSLFLVYRQFATIIKKRAHFIARNINYILSILFFILGILTVIKILK